jgi:hypothetical protein
VVPLRERSDGVDVLARVLPGHAFEVFDERLLAVSDVRVVLPVLVACVALDGRAWAALVEHQVVERDHIVAMNPTLRALMRV